jgi:hypothetical protein
MNNSDLTRRPGDVTGYIKPIIWDLMDLAAFDKSSNEEITEWQQPIAANTKVSTRNCHRLRLLTSALQKDCLVVSTYPSDKYEYELVSWDDDIPNIWKNKIHVPNHQPEECWTNIEMVRTEDCYGPSSQVVASLLCRPHVAKHVCRSKNGHITDSRLKFYIGWISFGKQANVP